MQSICVFCGSSEGADPAFASAAKWLGQELANKGVGLVYGGGKVGLMGIVADSCIENGGKVTGVIPKFLAKAEIAHKGITELIKVESMHQRKLKMSQLADGFIAMPGGFGTLEELCEILTWVQLSLVSKPIGIFNLNGYYDPLIAQFKVMVNSKLLKESNLKFFVESSDGKTLLQEMSKLAVAVNSFKDKFIHT